VRYIRYVAGGLAVAALVVLGIACLAAA